MSLLCKLGFHKWLTIESMNVKDLIDKARQKADKITNGKVGHTGIYPRIDYMNADLFSSGIRCYYADRKICARCHKIKDEIKIYFNKIVDYLVKKAQDKEDIENQIEYYKSLYKELGDKSFLEI